MTRKIFNPVGNRFGRWLVLEELKERKNSHIQYKCLCDCGTVTNVVGYTLRYGTSVSCGCVSSETLSKRNSSKKGIPKNPKYIKTIADRLYSMRARCHNPSSSSYNRYGGRGIQVCEEWREGLSGTINFIDWVIKKYPDWQELFALGYQFDRQNNNLGYSPSNCRLVSRETNNQNKSTTKIVVYNNKNYSVADFCREFSLKEPTTNGRLNRGWSPEEIINESGQSTSVLSITVNKEEIGIINILCSKFDLNRDQLIKRAIDKLYKEENISVAEFVG